MPIDSTEPLGAAQTVPGVVDNAVESSTARDDGPSAVGPGRKENLTRANKLSRTYVTLLEALKRHRGKIAGRTAAHPAPAEPEGLDYASAHVALSLPVSAAIIVGTLIFSMVLYAYMMATLQSSVKAGIDRAPVIRDILNPSLGMPLLPMLGTAVRAESTPEKTPDFDDDNPITPAQWLELLKRLGVVTDQQSTIDQFLGPAAGTEGSQGTVQQADQPVQRLISDLAKAAGNQQLGTVTALPLLATLATELDKASASSGSAQGEAAKCWPQALSQVMAGYPDRWHDLSVHLRSGRATDDKSRPAAGCPWTGQGEFAKQPSIPRYMIQFSHDVPNEADLTRALFEGTGALIAKPSDADSTTPLDRLHAEPDPGSDAVIAAQTKILAEQFGRQLLAATMATSDVSVPKLWLDMLVGWPQAILNWFFFMLLGLAFARIGLLIRMRREVDRMSAWLTTDKAFLTANKDVRSKLAETKARQLSAVYATGSPMSGNDVAPSGLRRHALVTLMAEKAIRRLIVGEAQPELFREFCAARRAMVDETAWPLRYLSRALPALGFVGTILGILFALNGADGIVRATTQAERISAMAAVTGPLAFAFAHTFIALAAGLVTGLLIDMETARERLLLLAYEELLIEKIDVAELEPV